MVCLMRMPPVRRLLFWGVAMLLVALASTAGWMFVHAPRPAWDQPVDVTRASFPPRVGAGDSASLEVPVWVVRPSPTGQPDWSDYLVEILRGEGVTSAQVGCGRLSAAPPESVRALVVPAGCEASAEAGLRRFVEAGGTLVGVGNVRSVLHLVGARVGGAGGGRADLAEFRPGVLQPLFQAVQEAPDTAVVRDAPSETGERWPLLLERRLGKGVVRLWCTDVARAVARTRQGDPRAVGKAGLLPNPSPGDLFQQDFEAKRYREPVVDTWAHRFGRSVVAGSAPIPVFWPFPGPGAAAIILTGDQDYAPDTFIDYQLAHVENAGGEMTLFLTSVTRENQAAPALEVAVQSPSPEKVGTWRAYHHQFSVHPNANGLPRDPQTLTGVIEASRQALVDRYGIVPRTIRHHFTFWWGYVDTARTLAQLGFLMDFNYMSIVPGASGEGYLNGAGLPLPFVDLDGTVLPIFQQPTQVEDSLMMSNLGFSAGLEPSDAVRVASRLLFDARRWGTAVTLNFHPLYSVKTPEFLDGLLSAARASRLPMMSAERWLDLVLRRYQARIVSVVTRTGTKGLEVSFDLTVPEGDLWVRLPDTGLEQRCVQVFQDGRPADTRRVDTPAALAGTLFVAGPGTHRIVAHYGAPASP